MTEITKLSRSELKKVIGGSSIGMAEECGWQAGGQTCYNNLCCSKYGYCGNTYAYCQHGADAGVSQFPCGCQSGPCVDEDCFA